MIWHKLRQNFRKERNWNLNSSEIIRVESKRYYEFNLGIFEFIKAFKILMASLHSQKTSQNESVENFCKNILQSLLL